MRLSNDAARDGEPNTPDRRAPHELRAGADAASTSTAAGPTPLRYLSPLSSQNHPSKQELPSGTQRRALSSNAQARHVPLAAAPRHLLAVIPPESLNLARPRSSQQYGPSDKFRRGTLIPLYPTLAQQLHAIASEYGLPSTGGMVLFLAEPDGGPRIGDEAVWNMLWGQLLEAEEGSIAEQEDEELPVTSHLPPFDHNGVSSDAQLEINQESPIANSDAVEAEMERAGFSSRMGSGAGSASSSGATGDSSLSNAKPPPRRPSNIGIGRRPSLPVLTSGAPIRYRTSPGSASSSPRDLYSGPAYAPYVPSSLSARGGPGSPRSMSDVTRESSRASAGAAVVVGKVEFDIDSRRNGRGKWYEAFLAAAETAARSPVGNSFPSFPESPIAVTSSHRELRLPILVAKRSKRRSAPVDREQDVHITGTFEATGPPPRTSSNPSSLSSGHDSHENRDTQGYDALSDDYVDESPNPASDSSGFPLHSADPLADVFGEDAAAWGSMGDVSTDLASVHGTGLGIEQVQAVGSDVDHSGSPHAVPEDGVGEVVEMLSAIRNSDAHRLASPIRLAADAFRTSPPPLQPEPRSRFDDSTVSTPRTRRATQDSAKSSTVLSISQQSSSSRSDSPNVPRALAPVATSSESSSLASYHQRESQLGLMAELDDLEAALVELSPKSARRPFRDIDLIASPPPPPSAFTTQGPLESPRIEQVEAVASVVRFESTVRPRTSSLSQLRNRPPSQSPLPSSPVLRVIPSAPASLSHSLSRVPAPLDEQVKELSTYSAGDDPRTGASGPPIVPAKGMQDLPAKLALEAVVAPSKPRFLRKRPSQPLVVPLAFGEPGSETLPLAKEKSPLNAFFHKFSKPKRSIGSPGEVLSSPELASNPVFSPEGYEAPRRRPSFEPSTAQSPTISYVADSSDLPPISFSPPAPDSSRPSPVDFVSDPQSNGLHTSYDPTPSAPSHNLAVHVDKALPAPTYAPTSARSDGGPLVHSTSATLLDSRHFASAPTTPRSVISSSPSSNLSARQRKNDVDLEALLLQMEEIYDDDETSGNPHTGVTDLGSTSESSLDSIASHTPRISSAPQMQSLAGSMVSRRQGGA